jgi:two-component system, chemotaxis family, CheB/CheR fusion protein
VSSDDSGASELDELLEFLRGSRGFDFAGYKRAGLERRISKRMAEVGVERFSEYQEYLELNSSEFTDLFNTILINVTSFFRDRPAWDFLAADVLPKLIESIPDGSPIRVWSAGCASGEEAYTAAMLIAELIGEEAFRARVKIYATDIDDDALNHGRHATYSNEAMKPIPEDLCEKYFEPNRVGHTFRGGLRRSIIFGRNDLVQDAPLSRIDLLISRNTLMYFIADAQAAILSRFNFALKERGFLFLGKSEMLLTHRDLFAPYNLKWRIFNKVPQDRVRERLAFIGPDVRISGGEQPTRHGSLRKAASDVLPLAQLVLDRTGIVTAVSERARTLFELSAADIGRPLQDLAISYRPADLRSALEDAYEQMAPVKLGHVPYTTPEGKTVTLDVVVTPLAGNGDALGASVTFEDVSHYVELSGEYDASKRQLETAYEELQSTVEELETTNEELQSTNEELETTNEELQSTNEELETTNEELHSTNEELETMNEEQRIRSNELDRLNIFLEGILGNLGVGVIVLDGDRRVQVWDKSAHDMWGLHADEVEGDAFGSLDIGLPVAELSEPIEKALSPERETSEITLDAVTRRGRAIQCIVRVIPLMKSQGEHYGLILLMRDKETNDSMLPPFGPDSGT